MKVQLTIEPISRKQKPTNKEIAEMTEFFGDYHSCLNLKEIAHTVGNCGKTFSPTVFSASRRCGDNFLQIQLFALDFDSGISYVEIKERADKYNIPFLFAYHTFGHSAEHEKFRVVLLHEIMVTDKTAAEIIIKLLMKIFVECDSRCKDVARLYCGGNDLFFYNEGENCFNIADLARAYYCYEYEREKSNLNKRIESFAIELQIETMNHCLMIERVNETSIDENSVQANEYIYIGRAEFSSFRIKKRYRNNIREVTRDKKDETQVRLSKGNQLEDICQLYRDFTEGNILLDHNLRFKLATNLRKISSGEKKFFQYLPLHTDAIENWEGQFSYIKKMGYAPESCLGCPYYDTCQHEKNMLLTVMKCDNKIRKLNGNTEFHKPEENYRAICDNLYDAIHKPEKGIYLISAQTAIGKTHAYTNYIKENQDLYVIIAVPTNMLKNEVAESFEGYSDAYVTPSYTEMGIPQEVIEEIEAGYQSGLKNVANTVLRKYKKRWLEDGTIYSQELTRKCDEYLAMRERLTAYPRIIITTHARLFTMSEEFLSRYTIVVDEDILLTSFQGIEDVSMETLKYHYFNANLPGPIFKRLSAIFQTQGDQYGKFEDVPHEDIEVSGLVFQNLMEATSFYIDADRKRVHYYIPKYLPKGKYIVMSATLSFNLFKMFYPDRYIYEYPRLMSKYQGNLIQYTAHCHLA